MQTKYFLNPLSTLFHPEIDSINGFKTIVYNVNKKEILKINKFGYQILKIINDNPGIYIDKIYYKILMDTKSSETELRNKMSKFLEEMTNRGVLLKKDEQE